MFIEHLHVDYVLAVTNTLNGFGPTVIPSTISNVDGFCSPGTTENVNFCKRAVITMNKLLLASVSPIQRCRPVTIIIIFLYFMFQLYFSIVFYI